MDFDPDLNKRKWSYFDVKTIWYVVGEFCISFAMFWEYREAADSKRRKKKNRLAHT